MICEKERVNFQAVASFSFAYGKTEMAAAFCMLYAISQFVYSKEL